jgi:hypothetical protein
MDALMHGNDTAVKELVELGADLNAFDKEVRQTCSRSFTL